MRQTGRVCCHRSKGSAAPIKRKKGRFFMKKLVRLTALLLAGALLLLMTACGGTSTPPATPETPEESMILRVVNQYRRDNNLRTLKEVKELSTAGQEWAELYRQKKSNPLSLTDPEVKTAWEKFRAAAIRNPKWKYCDAYGLAIGLNAKDVYLSNRLPATEQELMDQIKKEQSVFSKKDCDSIAIAVVTIEGAKRENTNGTYWMCILYQSVR